MIYLKREGGIYWLTIESQSIPYLNLLTAIKAINCYRFNL